MKLSQHFTLLELTKSQQALRLGIENRPGDPETANLERLAARVLEPVRAHFGKAFSPSSGFRCSRLNAAIGSKPTSQHIRGEAADFEVPGVANLELARWIRDNLVYDQLILEFYDGTPSGGWVHCSLSLFENRGHALTVGKGGPVTGLPDVIHREA